MAPGVHLYDSPWTLMEVSRDTIAKKASSKRTFGKPPDLRVSTSPEGCSRPSPKHTAFPHKEVSPDSSLP